jgi:hypothetical protein
VLVKPCGRMTKIVGHTGGFSASLPEYAGLQANLSPGSVPRAGALSAAL